MPYPLPIPYPMYRQREYGGTGLGPVAAMLSGPGAQLEFTEAAAVRQRTAADALAPGSAA